MDPRTNPYAPGAGSPPPELAGRSDIIERAAIALDRTRAGRNARSVILVGLRGVGKTVLLNHIRRQAEARGIICIAIETPEDRSLPALLVPALNAGLTQLSRIAAVRSYLERATRVLASAARAFKIKFEDVEFTLDLPGEPGVADSGNLERDLADLIVAIGQAAKERHTSFVLVIDEMQYVKEQEFSALIAALHRAAQEQLPVTMIAAGLPQLVGQAGKAKSYAERLFEFVQIGPLDAADATAALRKPAEREGVALSQGAIAEIIRQTQGYPYFLQEWGKHTWNIASASPIGEADAILATQSALSDLDGSFFRVRFDRLTPAEKRYMRAMAEIGPGPHRSGDIAEKLGKRVTAVAPLRATLIAKGMIYSPAHGDNAFTVPLFDGFMRRIMSFAV